MEKPIETVLLNFRKAWNELSDKWQEELNVNSNDSEKLNKDYPFNESFDDLGVSVSKWVDNSIKRLRK